MSKIYIYDQIGGNGIVALDVIKQLSDLDGDIDVHINSGGGSVSQGIAIYNALKEYEGQVHVFVDGLAASISSIIAMAGDTLTMAEGSLMMVHEVWTEIAGNAGELRKEAEVLEKHTNTILDIYESNTPLSRAEIKKMLEAETWLTAEEAYELGIATDISGALKQAASVNINSFMNAPKELEAIIALNTKSLDPDPEPEPEKSNSDSEQPRGEEEEEKNFTDKEFVARLESAKQRLATLTKLAKL